MIVNVSDFNAPELDVYARLTEAQLMTVNEPKEEGLFIAESPHVIERALEAGYRPVSLLAEDIRAEGLSAAFLERLGDIPIYTAPLSVLTQLTGFALTRGILCAMKRRKLPGAEELLAKSRRVCVLENVMNPTNLGAIFRSAAALGMDAVLLTPGSTDPLYRRAARVSMGTVFQIPWTVIGRESDDWPGAGMALLKNMGFETASMALRRDTLAVDDVRLKKSPKLAVILGTEGEGLTDRTLDLSDYTVKIPMSHGVDSLNVAAASAVVFYELGKQDE